MKASGALIFAIALLTGCARASNGTSVGAADADVPEPPLLDGGDLALRADGSVPKRFYFSYRLGPCFGTCPSFRIEVDRNGDGHFETEIYPDGATRSDAPIVGCKPFSIGVEGVKTIIRILQANHAFGLGPQHREFTCGQMLSASVGTSTGNVWAQLTGPFDAAEDDERNAAIQRAFDRLFDIPATMAAKNATNACTSILEGEGGVYGR